MMYCPKCQTQNDDGAAFCGNCGTELPNAVVVEAEQEQPKKKKKKSRKKWIIISVLSFVLLGIVGFFGYKYFFYNSGIIKPLDISSHPVIYYSYSKDKSTADIMCASKYGEPYSIGTFDINFALNAYARLSEDGKKIAMNSRLNSALYYKDISDTNSEWKKLYDGYCFFNISRDGSYVVYNTANDCFYYDVNNNTTERLGKSVLDLFENNDYFIRKHNLSSYFYYLDDDNNLMRIDLSKSKNNIQKIADSSVVKDIEENMQIAVYGNYITDKYPGRASGWILPNGLVYKGASASAMSDDGKYLYVEKNSSIYRYNITDTGIRWKKKIIQDIGDSSWCLYGDLLVVDGKAYYDGEFIDLGLSSPRYLNYVDYGDCTYQDEALYYKVYDDYSYATSTLMKYKDGKVEQIAENIYNYTVRGNYVYYSIVDRDNASVILYRYNNGKAEEVDSGTIRTINIIY